MATPPVLIASKPITAVKLRSNVTGYQPGPILRIPRYSIVRLLGTSTLTAMVDLEWQGERYSAFLQDVEERCERQSDGADASPPLRARATAGFY